MQHLHTEYERELVPLFVKVLLSRLMGSELEDDITSEKQSRKKMQKVVK